MPLPRVLTLGQWYDSTFNQKFLFINRKNKFSNIFFLKKILAKDIGKKSQNYFSKKSFQNILNRPRIM